MREGEGSLDINRLNIRDWWKSWWVDGRMAPEVISECSGLNPERVSKSKCNAMVDD